LIMPKVRGAYQLLISLDRPVKVRIGKLGTFNFPPGLYIYTGSAMGGIEGRVSRHLSGDKKLRWHIDYLLRHARVVGVREVRTEERVECRLNREALEVPNARVIVFGFGSSDCGCPSHLVYLGEELECGALTSWSFPS